MYPVESVIETLEPHVSIQRQTRMKTVLANRIMSLALGVEDLANSYNGAACIRTAEAMGIHDIVAAEGRNVYPTPENRRSPAESGVTMYAHRWVELHRVPTSHGLIDWAQSRGMRVVGTSPHAEKEVGDVSVDQPMLVLFGNEREGLQSDTSTACDDVFRLPMYGFTESFNVSVSVAITLADLTGRMRADLSGRGQTGDMPMGRQRHLLAQWYLRSVRRSDLIVARQVPDSMET